MASSKVEMFIRGKLSWAKVLGDPVLNYSKDAKEWYFEVEPDEKSLQLIIKNGLSDRIKGKGYNIGTKGQHQEKTPFLQLKKSELNKDGNPSSPIRIYDSGNMEWDRAKLIGNGSLADVKLDVRDYGVGKKKGVYPVAIRITEHVAYESSEFGKMDGDSADTPAPKQGKKASLQDDLNDDIPF